MSDFTSLGEQIGNLVAQKQEAYGDSYGKSGQVLEVLYPDGVRVDQYPTFLAVTRVIDKLFRVATKKDAFGESPWRDIAGYALLGIASDEKPITATDVLRSREEARLADRLRAAELLSDVEESIADYCRRKQIPLEVPENDAEVDTMGLRVIKSPCCDAFCHTEFVIPEELPVGSSLRSDFPGKEVCY
jgi:hypothetical protein